MSLTSLMCAFVIILQAELTRLRKSMEVQGKHYLMSGEALCPSGEDCPQKWDGPTRHLEAKGKEKQKAGSTRLAERLTELDTGWHPALGIRIQGLHLQPLL